MSVSALTASTQDYLKAVFALGEWSSAPVTPTSMAERMGLKLSSVSDAVRKLTAQGLLSHTPYGAVELTDEGRKHAISMVRRHRLIETFLVRALGYGWEQVHDEAEDLEHAVSDFMIERIDEFLGHPARDPHGDPIPSPTGEVAAPAVRQLSTVELPAEVRVERIDDDDPSLLQFLESHGVMPDARLAVRAGAPFSDAIEIAVIGSDDAAGSDAAAGSRETFTLGVSAAAALYVAA